MRFIVAVGWSIYPLDYFFGYVLGIADDNILNLTYNLADMLKQIWFVATILYEIFVGEGEQVAQGKPLNEYVSAALNTMRFIVAVCWSIYPLDYFLGYVLGIVDDNILNLTYNLAECIICHCLCLCICICVYVCT